MPIATVRFTHMIQDSQEFGSDDEHMVSRVFFSLRVGDQPTQDTYVNVKQTVGSSFADGPLEVSAPAGYPGPMNHAAMSAAVEKYYRSQVGAAGSGIRIVGAANARMEDNIFVAASTTTFEVAELAPAW